jgi:two-component system alkaline phosphatase synthesis response regulator PhoP
MAKKKVLVVEDEAHVARLYAEYLDEQGAKVFIAATGESAWDIFQKERPVSCLIDIRLNNSQYDGHALLEKIRSLDKKTYCVMLTAEDNKDLEQKSLSLGANEHINKASAVKRLTSLMAKLAE